MREATAAPVVALRSAWRSSPWTGLGGVMALGLGLRLWRLDGFGTEYYSAGVRSMLESPHNFLFNSFDPAGFVSLALRVKLRHLDDWVAARRRLAALYDKLLAGAPVIVPSEVGPARHCYHLYVIGSTRRDALQRHLRERGVGTSVHYPVPAHRQPAYRHLEYAEGDFPCAEWACRQVLSLPLYPELREEELHHVASAISSFRE